MPRLLLVASPTRVAAPIDVRCNLGQITDDLQLLALLRPETLSIVATVAKHLADPVRHMCRPPFTPH